MKRVEHRSKRLKIKGITGKKAKEDQVNNADHIPLDLLKDAFTRLPPKTIGRFRCVCKLWNHETSEPLFTELHRSFCDSQAYADAFRVLVTFTHKANQYFYSVNRHGEDLLHLLTVETSKFGFKRCFVSEVLNGLVCFFDYGRVLACNIITREITTLPDSSITKPCSAYRKKFDRFGSPYYPIYSFGFDLLTMEYKVLCVWVKYYDDLAECELFTLGTGSWRKIDPLPYKLTGSSKIHSESCCVNGVLYWPHWCSLDRKPGLVAFDVRDEKFGVIEVPVNKGICLPRPMRLGDRLALVSHNMSLVILEDFHNRVWIKKDFKLQYPLCSLVGTTEAGELLLIESIIGIPVPLEVFIYDVDGKNLGSIEIHGLPVLKCPFPIFSISKHMQNTFKLKRYG